jgi:hypothetical protein
MVLFYIRLFALQCIMSKNEKSLDVPKILSAKKRIQIYKSSVRPSVYFIGVRIGILPQSLSRPKRSILKIIASKKHKNHKRKRNKNSFFEFFEFFRGQLDLY